MIHIIGIDIGGTTSRINLAEIQNGKINIIKQSEVYDTQQFEPYDLINLFINFIIEVKQNTSITAVGISCGGPLDSKRGLILSPPNLPKWDKIEIVDTIEKMTAVKTYLSNDANAGALAEWLYGAGRGVDNMIFLTFGTGMGSGLILDGRLYTGTNDMAGEVGHMRLQSFGPVGFGKAGSFEGFCSGGGIAQYAKIKAEELKQQGKLPLWVNDIESLTAKDIGIKANENDSFALKIMDEVSTYLGSGLSILIDILNPQRIVIGSIYQRNEMIMKDKVYQQIAKEALSLSHAVCEIVPTELNESIGDISAITVGYYYGVKQNEK